MSPGMEKMLALASVSLFVPWSAQLQKAAHNMVQEYAWGEHGTHGKVLRRTLISLMIDSVPGVVGFSDAFSQRSYI